MTIADPEGPEGAQRHDPDAPVPTADRVGQEIARPGAEARVGKQRLDPDSLGPAADRVGQEIANAAGRLIDTVKQDRRQAAPRQFGKALLVAIAAGFALSSFLTQAVQSRLHASDQGFSAAIEQLSSGSAGVQVAALRAIQNLAFRGSPPEPSTGVLSPLTNLWRWARGRVEMRHLDAGRRLVAAFARSPRPYSEDRWDLVSSELVRVTEEWILADTGTAQAHPQELWFLFRAKVSRANAPNARLPGAQLAEADLRRSNLSAATLSGAHLEDATADSIDLSQALLNGAGLSGAHLRRAVLVQADARGARFRRAQMQNSDLRLLRADSADFRDANLEGANFSGATLRHARFEGSLLAGAIFDEADLTGADLAKARNLDQADLRFARNVDSVAKWPDGYKPAQRPGLNPQPNRGKVLQ
ncbi:MAG: pentapeptide repeat-containing protein [Gemmatimonadales bacterium]